jgi:sortase (surface protein transpeptidase)
VRNPRPAHSPSPRTRLLVAAPVGALIGALLLGSCTAAGDDRRPGPSPDVAPAPTAQAQPSASPASVPEVPTRSADLASLELDTGPAPVELSIASVDVTVPIDPVGVQADGQMEIPPLAERAGWYRFGAAPGSPQGTTVIAAHIDSAASAGLGPFSRLADVAIGDPVTVTLADGSVLSYTVGSVVAVPKPEVVWDDVFVPDGPPRLVLITCGGTFRPEVRSYSDNVIVTADPDGA